MLSARNEAHLAAGAKAVAEKHRVKVVPIAGDVSRADDVARLVGETERAFGGVDLLINNAGTGSNETIVTSTDEKWQYYWDLQVMAAVRLARALAPSMQKRGGGVILHNASICAKQPLGYEPIYNVTKAALMMFSKCLSDELIGQNIRVNCHQPRPRAHPRLDQDSQGADAGQRHHLAAAPRQDRQRQCAHRTFRFARRGGRSVRLPLLGAIELLHRLYVRHRWRLAEERGVTS